MFFRFSSVVFIFGNVTVTLVQSPPPNSSFPPSQGFLIHSSPGESSGSETQDTESCRYIVHVAQLVEHHTLVFSGPSFESRSVCMVSHYFSHNGTCTIPSVCCKFYSMIYQSTYICDRLFCRTYYLLEQWMELSEGGTSGIPRPPSVTSEVIPWLSGESRSHYQK